MADQNINNMTVTWNSGGTTFSAVKMNVTDTASAAASLLLQFQVGGSDKFKVGKDGSITSAANLTLAGNATITGNVTISGTLTAAGIVGTVTGPGAATDNAVARFNGTTGGVIQNSGVIIDDSNNITGAARLTVSTAGGSAVVVDRSAGANAIFEAKTTSGSVFFGQGTANTFAVNNVVDLTSSPWLTCTASAFAVNKNTTITGTLTMTSSIDLQNGVIGRSGATISLRPNGIGSTSGQFNVTTTGDVTASASVSASQSFVATGGNIVLATTGAAGVFLRPNGAASTTGQTVISSSGNMSVSGDVTASSDRRLKKSIAPLSRERASTMVRELAPVTYTKQGLPGIGFIAQEVQPYAPELVHEDPNGMLSLAYPNMVAILWEAVRDLQAAR